MTVYVDAPRVYLSSLVKRGAALRSGLVWSHLWADDDDELHAFAARLGMRREWHQPAPAGRPWRSHYDLTPRRRAAAVALGAVEVETREYLARRMREARGQP